MDCPVCGYVLDPFDTECPRCARMKAEGRTPPPPPETPTVPHATAVASGRPGTALYPRGHCRSQPEATAPTWRGYLALIALCIIILVDLIFLFIGFNAQPESSFSLSFSERWQSFTLVLANVDSYQEDVKVGIIWRIIFSLVAATRLVSIAGVFARWRWSRWGMLACYACDLLLLLLLSVHIVGIYTGDESIFALLFQFSLRWSFFHLLPAAVFFAAAGVRETMFADTTALFCRTHAFKTVLYYLVPVLTFCLIGAALLILLFFVIASGTAEQTVEDSALKGMANSLHGASFLLTAWLYLPIPLGIAGAVAYFTRKRWGPHALMGYYLGQFTLLLLAMLIMVNQLYDEAKSSPFGALVLQTSPLSLFWDVLLSVLPVIGVCIVLPLALVIVSAYVNRDFLENPGGIV